MTYYGSKELAASYRTVRNNTLKIAEEIPEEKYSFRAAEGTRSIGETLAHIAFGGKFVETINFIEKRSNMEGFNFPALMGSILALAAKPRTKAETIALLKEEGDKFAKLLEGCSEEFLGESIAMPPGGDPPSRTRFDMLASVKEHEMHHRGQLMLLERMIGIVPHLTRAHNERMAAMQAAAQK
jgi:uncharacterized damage-inducible protein DinB